MSRVARFVSGPNELAFVYEAPAVSRNVGVLFVHAGGGNRLGPHRMFVEMARAFNAQGYPTFRFDLSGCGDSGGKAGENGTASEVCDTVNAIRHFHGTAGLDGVVVFSISRGSRLAFEAAAEAKLPLAGMILLSAPLSSTQAALRNTAAYGADYLRKLKDPKYLRRLVKGKVNLGGVWRTLAHAWRVKDRYGKSSVIDQATVCPVLLIYAGNDPMLKESRRHYVDRCEQIGAPVECYIIEHANHSFFHYHWKEQIADIALAWLGDAQSEQAT